MTFHAGLATHLAGGSTTVARTFVVSRRDGLQLGFTDHDRDLEFDGIRFRADAGLTAKAISQMTGLAVDNSEVFGALRSDAIREDDLLAGRYDDAEVQVWLVNWTNVSQRTLMFRGTIGEVVRSGGGFKAEVRGLSEALNKPVGRIYHGRCSAVLGDGACGFDLTQAGFRFDLPVDEAAEGRVFGFAAFPSTADRWFEKGRLTVLTGVAAGLVGVVKNDRLSTNGSRQIEVWQPLGLSPVVGDLLRIEAGCDKRPETCRVKFANFLNFQGFPHVPGEDWLMSYPTAGSLNDGGSLQS